MSGTDDKITALEAALAGAMGADRPRLGLRLERLTKQARRGREDRKAMDALAADITRSAARRAWRMEHAPKTSYPEHLPVSDRRDEIARAIAAHPVLIVAGETGSGKTTQLPKICLDAGRGVDGMIGHTQPRRIAARSLAERIAHELATPLGHAVGCKMRFHDHTHADTFVKVMTDGILLAETRGDPLLSAYDTILIDEAHERSLNIDFLLGYLKQLLPKRPGLRVIVTSATIDTARFAAHFGGAPVIEVSGRTYPVEVRYRPLVPEHGEPRTQVQGILDAVDEVAADPLGGDTLVFLSGEREIRETTEALRKHHPKDTDILPLYARLSSSEQGRVFQPGDRRRIVLATNVAETSLTVPRIRYVVDPGRARVSRYSTRSKVQRLPVEDISRASADQRKGRCGRLADGVCIRLYSEADYLARPEFTEPEVRRTNLAAVILRMLELNLGDVADFPFVDPPDRKQIADGFALLGELGAVDGRRRITRLGREMAGFNVDPRLARMILEARRENCLTEVLVLAAALSVPDPRERPEDEAARADQAHARFRDEASDFVTLLNLWAFFEENARHLSQNKLRTLCKANYLSFRRLREWRDIHREIAAQVRQMGFRPNQQTAEDAEIHRALLAGLLGHVGERQEKRTYTGARGLAFHVFPGSGLHRKPPPWIVAAELVETGKLYARTCARIEPEWVERVAGRLLKRTHFEPRWERKKAAVMAFERTTLYGLVITPKRTVPYGPVDPAAAREIFIRSALAEGAFDTRAPFFTHNRALIAEIEGLEAKSRRRDVLVDEEALYAFYDARVPEDINNGRAFEKWRREAEADNPRLLFLTRADLMRHGAEGVTADLFPEHLEVDGAQLALSYRFHLGDPADGVTATVPLHLLGTLHPEPFEWLVPGMLRDKAGALLKGLPKPLRKRFMPWPHWAGRFADAAPFREGNLREALGRFLRNETGTAVPPEAWDMENLPDHLRMRFRVMDETGREVAVGRDLAALQEKLAGAAAAGFARLPKQRFERQGLTTWTFGDLPGAVSLGPGGAKATGHPALVDEGDSVALLLLERPEQAERATRDGVLRLAMLHLPQQMKRLHNMALPPEALLRYTPLGKADDLRRELARAVLGRLLLQEGVPTRQAVFEARLREAAARVLPLAAETAKTVDEALEKAQQAREALKASRGDAASLADAREQFDRLIYPGFLSATPFERLKDLPRYLSGLLVRLERMDRDPRKDLLRLAELRPLWEACTARLEGGATPELVRFRWLLEELRVSLFAQELGTAEKVSVPRLAKLWREIGA